MDANGKPAGGHGPGLDKKFNSDLLLGSADQERARAMFPGLMPVLHDAALLVVFAPHDAAANRAKRNGHRWGMVAVALATLALLLASGHEVFSALPKPWPKVIGGVAAGFGILGLVIAAFGGLHTRAKHHWLLNRLMTERLRQFHFQFFVANARAIAHAAAHPETMEAVLAARRAAFAAFQLRHEGHLPGELSAIIADEGEDRAWVVTAPGAPPAPRAVKASALKAVYDTYRLLRIDHQLGYCDYQLRSASALGFKSPRQKAAVLTFATFAAIGLVFGLHILEAIGVVAGISAISGAGITLAATWLALLTLGVRALEEGLKPKREIERYRRYRAKLVTLRTRLEAAPDDEARSAVMREVEVVSYAEMREFLAVHEESAFVL